MGAHAWQKFVKGDDASFSELYRHYYHELLAYGLKIGFNEESCKDAIQDVFFKIYTSRSRLTHVENIEFYLLLSVKNRLFDLYKGEIKTDFIPYDDIILDKENSVVEKIIDRETQLLLENKIKQSIKILPPRQRKIIYWHYHLNLSFSEIAAFLGVKPETVRRSINRALQKMQESNQLKNFPLPFILVF